MLIGTTNAGKSTFINNVLNLIPGITGPSVNESYGQSTTKDFKKYNSTIKKGINLWDSEGCDIDNNITLDIILNRLDNLMVNKEKLIFSENKLIYGFFYFIEKDSFNEENKLNYLIGKYSKKIPLKIMITKFKSEKQKKRIKNKIEMEMNLTPYFLGYNEDDPNHISEYNNNLRNSQKK